MVIWRLGVPYCCRPILGDSVYYLGYREILYELRFVPNSLLQNLSFKAGVQCTYQLRESKSVSWAGKTAAGEGGRADRVAALEGEGDLGGVTVVRDVGRQRLQKGR